MIRILLSTRLGEMRWTQADLARATGIRPNTINELFHVSEDWSLDEMPEYCSFCGAKMDEEEQDG